VVKFNNGQEDLSIAFNVCDFARREPADGKRDFANLLSGGEIQGDYKHLTSDLIEDVQVELLGKFEMTWRQKAPGHRTEADVSELGFPVHL
jgi:hypothetical protein